jgi:ribosomal-protein-alanine N-acetyltransferase
LKAGFTQEGLARRYLRINGEWRDHLTFGILRDDPRPTVPIYG